MRIELTYKGFADLSLTTWVPRHLTFYCVLNLFNEVYTTGKSAGKRKQKLVMLAPKNDQYRSWADVEPIIQRVLGEVNTGQ